MKKIFSHVLAVIGVLVVASAAASAQDFNKTYQLGPGGHINIRGVSGNITVAGYDGGAVVVTAVREGRDLDKVSVEDLSAGDRIELRAKYPEQCNNCDATLHFQLQVPRSIKYNFDKLSTASGNIEISAVTGVITAKSASGNVSLRDVSGEVNASSASGNVKVRNTAGVVNARSASGNVEVEISQLEGSGNMEFSSASGDVSVKAPASLDADIEMSSLSGALKTDFPIQVQERQYGPGRTARGKVGSGLRTIKVKSVSGNVSLERF